MRSVASIAMLVCALVLTGCSAQQDSGPIVIGDDVVTVPPGMLVHHRTPPPVPSAAAQRCDAVMRAASDLNEYATRDWRQVDAATYACATPALWLDALESYPNAAALSTGRRATAKATLARSCAALANEPRSVPLCQTAHAEGYL